MTEFDAAGMKTKLRQGRVALSDEIIEGLHKAGEKDFLDEFYSVRYAKWLADNADSNIKDAGDRNLVGPGAVQGHPDFVEVDRRIAADTR